MYIYTRGICTITLLIEVQLCCKFHYTQHIRPCKVVILCVRVFHLGAQGPRPQMMPTVSRSSNAPPPPAGHGYSTSHQPPPPPTSSRQPPPVSAPTGPPPTGPVQPSTSLGGAGTNPSELG